MIKEVSLALGILAGVGSIVSFDKYLNKALDTHETELLKGTAGYVQKYEGDPKEALDYVQRTLKIVEQAKFQPDKISDLEKEVSIAIKQIGESPTVYRPVLDSISKKLEEASYIKERNSTYLVSSIVGAFGYALLLISSALTWKKKNSFL